MRGMAPRKIGVALVDGYRKGTGQDRADRGRRAEVRGKSTGQGTFSLTRTHASIHETYGFSARLMGTETMGRLMAGLDFVLEIEVRSASSDLDMGFLLIE